LSFPFQRTVSSLLQRPAACGLALLSATVAGTRRTGQLRLTVALLTKLAALSKMKQVAREKYLPQRVHFYVFCANTAQEAFSTVF
jgi:hypothetical protein